MKKTLLALVVLAVGIGFIYQPHVGASQPAVAYGIELDVQPVETLDDVYQCQVTVKQGDEVVAAPRVQFEAGGEGQTRSSNPKTGEVVDFMVVSDPKTGSVTYTVEIRGGGGLLVARHHARVLL